MAGACFPVEPAGEPAPGPDEFLLSEREHLVRAHLEEILASPEFLKSRRLREFLRFIVQRTLDGHASELKERVIGMEVFGRGPDYDTAADHSVRVAASDLRRRLAQFYQEHGAGSQVRIELHPGSYVPQFRFNGGEAMPLEEAGTDPWNTGRSAARLWKHVKAHTRPVSLIFGITALAIAFAASYGKLGSVLASERAVFREFWSPVAEGDARPLVCLGEARGTRARVGSQMPAEGNGVQLGPKLGHIRSLTHQVFHAEDAAAAVSIAGTLREFGARPYLLSDSAVTLGELKESPAVFIGLLSNAWSRNLMGELRFRIVRDDPGSPQRLAAIVDTQSPDRRWEPELEGPGADPVSGYGVLRDYALVARLWHPQAGRPVIMVGGILGYGSLAAAEFVCDPASLRQLTASAPRDWRRRKLEAVISVDIVNGANSRPRLVAWHVW